MELKYYLLLFIIGSCKPPQSELIEINPRNWSENTVSLSEIADDVVYIKLDSCFDITTSSIRIKGNSIAVRTSEGIFLLSRDGKFVSKIGAKGRGPEEYIASLSFAINERTESVYVYDFMGNKIIIYTRNGKYIRSFPLPRTKDGSQFGDIDFIGSEILVSQYINVGHAQYNWIIIDTVGNIKSKKENSIPPFKSGLGSRGGIYSYRGKIGYWNTFNDTVFSIFSDYSYKESLLFTSGEHRIPRSIETNNPANFMKWMFPINIFETDRFFVFRYNYSYKACALIDKRSGKVYLENTEKSETEDKGIENNIDGGPRFVPYGYLRENNREYLIGYLDPLKLKRHISGENFIANKPEFPERKVALKKIADSIEETGNAILVLVRLKK